MRFDIIAGILARRIEIVDAGLERSRQRQSQQHRQTQHDSTHGVTSSRASRGFALLLPFFCRDPPAARQIGPQTQRRVDESPRDAPPTQKECQDSVRESLKPASLSGTEAHHGAGSRKLTTISEIQYS